MSKDPKYAGLYKPSGKVIKRLYQLRDERRDKIKALFEEEHRRIKKQSEEYLAYIGIRQGEIVAYIPTTSRKNPHSKYFTGLSNKGGATNDAKKENEKFREEQKNSKE